MLDPQQIDAITADVVRTYLPSGAEVSARSFLYDGIDSDDQLHVMIVMKESDFSRLIDKHALDLLYEVQAQLRAGGEDRFATLEFTTVEEMAADGGA